MNEHINRLLKIMPGIVCHRTGIIQEQIDFQDWTKMLTMNDIETNVDVGSWVQVHKGTYKGDVGHVLASELWGVCLLLVPCPELYTPPQSPGGILELLEESHHSWRIPGGFPLFLEEFLIAMLYSDVIYHSDQIFELSSKIMLS